jgi:hypothetical protein
LFEVSIDFAFVILSLERNLQRNKAIPVATNGIDM